MLTTIFRRSIRADLEGLARRQAEGIWVADKEGKLRPEVKEVLELVAQHGAILGTSHLASDGCLSTLHPWG